MVKLLILILIPITFIMCSQACHHEPLTPKQQAAEEAQIKLRKEQKEVAKCESDWYMAFLNAQPEIKKLLKSPTTAQFSKEETVGNNLGGCFWELIIPVDSQNSFGAMMRTNMYILAQYQKNDQYLFFSIVEDSPKARKEARSFVEKWNKQTSK